MRLRLLQLQRSLANALFQQPLIVLQFCVELAEAAAGRFQQVAERHASPRSPAEQDQGEDEGRRVLAATEFWAQRQKAEADGMQSERRVGDRRRMADRTD